MTTEKLMEDYLKGNIDAEGYYAAVKKEIAKEMESEKPDSSVSDVAKTVTK